MIDTMPPIDSPSDPDRTISIEDGPEIEIKVKGSRFLAQALRVDQPEEVEGRLGAIRKQYHDATHHCWAYRLGMPGRIDERHEDDGEPTGTAGVPILQALRREEILGGLLVVTRYFGGVKLGTGGLVRAYSEAATEALMQTPRRTVWLQVQLAVGFEYDDLGLVEATLAKTGDAILSVSREFEPHPKVVVSIKRSRADDLKAALIEASGGRVELQGEGD